MTRLEMALAGTSACFSGSSLERCKTCPYKNNKPDCKNKLAKDAESELILEQTRRQIENSFYGLAIKH